MASQPRFDAHNDFKLPTPPPPLHTRSTNDMYDNMPSTPSRLGFTSPSQTPQGSPSKHHLPPGAYDLPNVFDNAMKLLPASTSAGSPSKKGGSPTRSDIHIAEDSFGEFPLEPSDATPGSPTRKSNKENTPPTGGRPGLKKEPSYLTQAAASRQEIYKTREAEVPRPGYQSQRGLTAGELDILQKPAVKRLTGVTQLCKHQLSYFEFGRGLT